MTTLTNDDLERMRDAVAATLPGTAVLSSRSYAGDSGGGGTTSWVPYGTVECRLSPAGPGAFGREVTVAERLRPQDSWLLTVPSGTSVRPESRVGTYGQTFEVLSVHQPRSWELAARVELMEAAA